MYCRGKKYFFSNSGVPLDAGPISERERGGAILTVQPAQKIRAGHLRHNSTSAVVPKRHTLFGIIFEIIVLG